MKHFLITVSCVLFSLVAVGQHTSSPERPKWVDGIHLPGTYSYIETTSAIGYNEENARNKAAQIIVERRSLATGQRVNVIVKDGTILVEGHDQLTVKARVIDEYREYYSDGQCRVSLLVQIAENPTYDFDNVRVTNEYPFSARVFVPGMAQLHKGSTAKGVLFIAGQVAMVGGIVVAESLRTSYESKIGSTHNAANRQTYINNAGNMQNLRNGFIAGAVAIYAWNVIDGIVANGKKHIVFGEAQLRFIPYATPQSAGVLLTLKF